MQESLKILNQCWLILIAELNFLTNLFGVSAIFLNAFEDDASSISESNILFLIPDIFVANGS